MWAKSCPRGLSAHIHSVEGASKITYWSFGSSLPRRCTLGKGVRTAYPKCQIRPQGSFHISSSSSSCSRSVDPLRRTFTVPKCSEKIPTRPTVFSSHDLAIGSLQLALPKSSSCSPGIPAIATARLPSYLALAAKASHEVRTSLFPCRSRSAVQLHHSISSVDTESQSPYGAERCRWEDRQIQTNDAAYTGSDRMEFRRYCLPLGRLHFVHQGPLVLQLGKQQCHI